ncbi:unnamed protein product [Amoebophrya sp. A120]|nr:unnamed protein product [Amoebophrya sp. A120]|eukprot:GSA120T00014866001.1
MSRPAGTFYPDDAVFLSRATSKNVTQTFACTGDNKLALLMNAIQNACKVVAHAIRRAGISNLYGQAGDSNASGDDVKKLDVLANEIWVHSLKQSGVCCLLVSEEEKDAIVVHGENNNSSTTASSGEDGNSGACFCVAFDPLDGSSNIDCNVSVGSIFSIYKRLSPMSGKATVDDILRPGTEIVAAGYSMYGAGCELVISAPETITGVQRYQLDPSIGEFMFIENIKIPSNGGKKIYSCNEGNSKHWDKGIHDFVNYCKENDYTARYVGSMVSDVHRSLLYGGVFLYPADQKSTKGKLRVLYEGFPMALITEQAGGLANTGMFRGKCGRILEVNPEKIHDRCPIIMGCVRDVQMILKMIEDTA